MSKKLLNMCLMAIMMVISMSVYALNKVGNVYQIGTADDLKAFAELVNGGEAYANAVLIADIDKGADLTMIGRDGLDYQGSFDGKGYTITVSSVNQASEGTAIFRNVGRNALIQNLKVTGTITTNQKLAAGIAVYNTGVIRGCYSDISVTSAVAGDATHGGIAAVTYQGALIEDCLAKFVITGTATQNCGGIVGWCSGRTNIMNCLVISDGSSFDLSNEGSNNIGRNDGNLIVVNLEKYLEEIYNNRPAGACYNNYVTNQWGTNKATTVVPKANLADGRICYQLNNDQSRTAWVQQIGTDPFPVPAAFGKGRVYASAATGCNGKAEVALTFSNSGTDKADKHDFDKFGICSVCGCYNYLALERDATDGYLLLKTAEDIDLAEGLSRITEGGQFSLKMADNIEYVAEPGRNIFNTGNWFDGNFNGDGHELTIEMTEMGSNASLFPQFAGTFENVIMHGTIETSGQYAGSITSHTRRDRVKIQNVFSDIEINASRAGDNTIGGFIGVAETKTIIDNVIYAGNINGNGNTECLAGFCGWSSGQTYWTNCAFVGALNEAIGDSKTISRNPGNVVCENVYSINDYGFGDDDKFILFESGEDGVSSGELAYYLNGKQAGAERFYQKIGKDDYPMPIKKEGALVYAISGGYRCDGTPIGTSISYSNDPSSTGEIPPHTFVDGWCTVCEQLDENFLTPVNGWYEISNGAELEWWTNYAAKHLDASAKLTADIDMDGYCDRWANVGTEGAPFYGNFDGQFHTISNLVVDKPESNGVGLIAVMNSLPEAGFGGISDADARAAEGVYIKNVTLDESCSLLGHGYVGLVGMTAPWAGHVNIKGVMMCGDVTANGGPNASGVFGCVMGSSCHVTIDNCGMVGDVYGPKENGSFSGWLGNYAEVTNCFAVGSVEGIESNERYFARYNSATITNCYAKYGTQVPLVSDEDFQSGALAWKANGNQFRTSYWYQTIGDDMYPFADPSHGTVIYAANQYMSATDDALDDVINTISDFYDRKTDDVIAYTGTIEDLNKRVKALNDASSINELADVLDSIYVYEAIVDASASVYKKYQAKCEEIGAYLAEHDDFEGGDRDDLEDYLDGEALEILEDHVLPDSLVEQEITRVEQWLALAIANGYMPGTDVTKMLVNADFSQGKDKGWSGEAKATGHATVERKEGGNLYGVESWSDKPFAMSQTVTGMKPGYYLVGVNGAYRPQNNRYSYNYAAQISANGVVNYLQTVIEDPILAEQAVDSVNANITGPTSDLGISSDGITTDFSDDNPAEGYVVHGPYGMAIAASAGRYKNYIACEVGADSVLTIGIANPHSKAGTYEWTGASNVSLVFLGTADDKEATEGLATALESQLARANTLLGLYEYTSAYEDPATAPNYPEELKNALDYAIAGADAAETAEEKMAAILNLSQLFQDIYAGKQAYVKMANKAIAVETALTMLAGVLSDEEYEEIYDSADEICAIYEEGSLSLQDALEFDIVKQIPATAKIVAPQDENGTYQISTPMQLIFFNATVTDVERKANAVLTKDINMAGIPFTPIAQGTRYNGIFDGQQFAIKNLVIGDPELFDAPSSAGLFSDVENGTVKNLKVQSTIYTSSKFAAGISGYTRNAKIQDCDVDVTVHSMVEGDGTHGGIAGVNEVAGTVVENCKVHFVLDGEKTNSWGGVFGWSTNADQVKNTLIFADIVAADLTNSNSVSRNNGNCSCSNVFFTTKLNDANIGSFISATDEKFKTGALAWALNGSSAEDPHWFQTLGKDDMPHLFSGSIVWKNGEEYFNSRPNNQLNAFASNLSTTTSKEQVVVAYTLNAEAKSGAINFYAGNELKYAYVLKGGDLMAGGHEIAIDNGLLGVPAGTKVTYELDITSLGVKDVVKVGDSYKVYGPYGMAINNNPASKGFGQLLLVESWVRDYGQGYISTDKPGALYAFNANFQPINAVDGTPGFYGGLSIKNETPLVITGDNKFDLKDIRFTVDGRLFVARAAGLSNSSVYEINPEDLNEPWKPVFKGGELDEATGITYVGGVEQNRMAVSLAFEGKGADLKMYVLGGQRSNGESNTTDYNCSVYNLGTATEWTGAPSANFKPLDGVYTYAPSYVGIQTDGLGGLWFIQNSNTKEKPALKHFDATGNEDYTGTTSTNGCRIAVTTDGKYIAIPQGSGKIVLYETNYVPMGEAGIWLEPYKTIYVSESSITSLAFDYANNLYVASGGTETLSRYAIPSWNDNKSVTPAAEGFVVGTVSGDPDGIENVNVNVNNGVIYNIAGQRVSKAQKGIYVVDGKKTLVK